MTTILHCSRTALKSRIGRMLWAIIRTVILLGLCYIILYPFIVKILNGLKDSSDFLDPTVRFIPKHFNIIHRPANHRKDRLLESAGQYVCPLAWCWDFADGGSAVWRLWFCLDSNSAAMP